MEPSGVTHGTKEKDASSNILSQKRFKKNKKTINLTL
jgi:hypothetical protein